MAHELENASDMTYVGDVPWHGLGDKVDELYNLPPCLDWQVQKKLLSWFDAEAKVPIAINDQFALVRSDTHKLLGIASDQYQPHQNATLWDTFKHFADAGNMKLETAGALKGGKLVWALAKIDKSFNASVSNDRQDLYALLASAHDKSMASITKATSTRVVCWNTLSVALMDNAKGGEYRQSHRSTFNVNAAKDFVSTAILGFERYQGQVEKLQSAKINGINRPLAEAFVAELVAPDLLVSSLNAANFDVSIDLENLNRKLLVDNMAKDEFKRVFCAKLEKDANRPLKLALHDTDTEQNGIAGKTAWGLVNGITRYVDHTHGRNSQNRLASAWFGQGDNLKTDALNLGLQYASILQ